MKKTTPKWSSVFLKRHLSLVDFSKRKKVDRKKKDSQIRTLNAKYNAIKISHCENQGTHEELKNKIIIGQIQT